MHRGKKSGLKTYRAKRHFGVTSEPLGKIARKRGNVFVIQKHAARRLHYDLRLELDGVMKSWAVTRGPSLVPGEKRLAVQVEDHPIAYNKFEGTIPQGEYGGGTVMIWDRGRWEPENDPHEGLTKGHLAFKLDGEKLRGGWHLIRMRRRSGEKRDNWLLIKQHDEAERQPNDTDILEEKPRSVDSGRSMDEITKGLPKRTPSSLQPHASKRALPAFIKPCLATLADKPPDSANWIHEIKFDGYRIQARLERGKVRLLTRKGLDWTRKFPSIAAAISKLPASSALIDGEVVVEGDNGISSFSLLQQDLVSKRHDRMAFYAFDLMHLDGTDLRALPLKARKATLAKLLGGGGSSGSLRFSESLTEPGTALFRHACKMGLEGIMSKLADAPYRSGRGRDWVKAKCSDRQELVIAGFARSTADARAVGSLVLGFYRHGKLRYAGRTGTGFTHATARELYRKLNILKVDRTPFDAVPAEERGARSPVWVAPQLVAEIEFRGWTHAEHVRQASFQGLREDKAATDVVREMKKDVSAVSRGKVVVRQRNAERSEYNAKTKFGAVTLTHPERVYWEDAGITKKNLADYYTQVWKWMRPHVTGRPIALVRCPDGTSGQCFFQKHASAGIATEHLRLVPEKGDKIISIDDLDGLIALVQAGVLEIHTRGSTVSDRERADRLVFDLDPGPETAWKDVVAAAHEVRDRLTALKLKSFLKTSGGKGLHVVVPIRPVPWDEAKTFTHAIAASMAMDSPDRYIATATKSRRSKRIFVDYLRNSREATTVAPYSTRARAGAPVSLPIEWSGLGRLKAANEYTVKNLMQRLSHRKRDPWAMISRVKQSLPKLK